MAVMSCPPSLRRRPTLQQRKGSGSGLGAHHAIGSFSDHAFDASLDTSIV
jgi:hypothetical protein